MKTTKRKNAFVEIGNRKVVISFDPPAVGILCRNIFSGEYIIAENSKVVPITFEQAENIIKTNFSH